MEMGGSLCFGVLMEGPSSPPPAVDNENECPLRRRNPGVRGVLGARGLLEGNGGVPREDKFLPLTSPVEDLGRRGVVKVGEGECSMRCCADAVVMSADNNFFSRSSFSIRRRSSSASRKSSRVTNPPSRGRRGTSTPDDDNDEAKSLNPTVPLCREEDCPAVVSLLEFGVLQPASTSSCMRPHSKSPTQEGSTALRL